MQDSAVKFTTKINNTVLDKFYNQKRQKLTQWINAELELSKDNTN